MDYTDYKNSEIGNIVANDFRTATIFKEAGIDFCCGGKKTLEKACSEKNIEPETVIRKLQSVTDTYTGSVSNFNDWGLDFLCDYIMNTHHKYVLKTLPDLTIYTKKLADVHGGHHPELIETATLFEKINTELLQHLKNEEEVLFPAIKSALRDNDPESRRTIRTEIERMSGEHEFAGGAMDRINELTGQYLVPADGCNTYHLTFKLLGQFEDDLHIHVHLENNILYRKALLI